MTTTVPPPRARCSPASSPSSLLAACGSDNTTTSGAGTTAAPAATTATTAGRPADAAATTTTEPGRHRPRASSQERCAANKAAGKITYLSSFDFAAAASILDVVVAKDRGYFDDLCLDVDHQARASPRPTTRWSPAGQAQFSSAGSYTEILNYSKDGAKFVAVADYGKTPDRGARGARRRRQSPRCRT